MSNIEWTDSTWNPVIGCAKIAAGCKNCYAETMSKRLAAMGQADYASILDSQGRFSGKAITRPDTLAEPLRWKKPRMVFVNSMSDLFHEDVSFEFIAAVFGVMAACPQHTFQVLTKRPKRALEFFAYFERAIESAKSVFPLDDAEWRRAQCLYGACLRQSVQPPGKGPTTMTEAGWPLNNVWLGVSVATQADADKNIPVLLKCHAAVRFVSAEPLIEAVDFTNLITYSRSLNGRLLSMPALDWVIAGGESGPGARPCDVAWIRSIVEQCQNAGVPVFVKQLGADVRCATSERWPSGTKWFVDGVNRVGLKDRKGGDPSEWPTDLRVREFPEVRS